MEQKNSGILYHASCVAGLKELTPRASTHGEAYVYAIDNAVTALLFGAPKDDFDVLVDEEGMPARRVARGICGAGLRAVRRAGGGLSVRANGLAAGARMQNARARDTGRNDSRFV